MRPAGSRSSNSVWLAVAALLALLVAGCGVTAPGPVAEPGSDVATVAELAAMRRTVDRINAAARTPADQSATLLELVADDQLTAQRNCAPATTTVRLEPVWRDVQAVPGHSGRYAVPTVVRVFTAGRLTGTDLTALTLTVGGVTATTTVLCVA